MAAADTPMMREYLELKKAEPDALLLYRMGDFYECFFEDAHEAGRLLELVVTSRNKNDPDPIPMAGFPYRALEPMLGRLSDAGRRVAVAEQRELSPGVFTRELVRVVSAGLPYEAESVEAREPCFLAALTDPGAGTVGIAVLDATTGELQLMDCASEAVARALGRLDPREVLVPAGSALGADAELHATLQGRVVRPVDADRFDPAVGRARLRAQLGGTDLKTVGADTLGPSLGAAAALLTYATDHARVSLRHLVRVRVVDPRGALALDDAARRNLELLRPLRGEGRTGALITLIDRTSTPMGGRLLRAWMLQPLMDLAALGARQAAVERLQDGRLRGPVRAALSQVADIDRLCGKIAQERGNARDLLGLASSLRALPALQASLAGRAELLDPALDLLPELADDIERWIIDEPPASLTEGGIIRGGVDEGLDELRLLATEGRGAIAHIEARERAASGISTLKIKYNKVFGYFLEVPQSKLDRVPERWIRKQTLSNCERFITPALKEFEDKVLGADERSKALEYERFVELRQRVAARTPALLALSAALARLDVLATFAELGAALRWTLPRLDDGDVIDIRGGRHPVIEATSDEPFVPNDLVLSQDQRLVILTGPNMAGKSTIMRQTALIVLLAQMGAPVPADRARIGLCDRIFVRVGASDDLSRGRSTFMVEMAETAAILHQATPRSLVLLDEIGRGTSTYDGLSIAWATAEQLVDTVRSRTIFATHYHELVALADDRAAVTNLHVKVAEAGDTVEFLRILGPGGASKSYGLQCARLAGMPRDLLERARALLAELERRPRHGPPNRQLGLFARPEPPPAPRPPAIDPSLLAVRDELVSLQVDELTPKAALDILYRLAALAKSAAGPLRD